MRYWLIFGFLCIVFSVACIYMAFLRKNEKIEIRGGELAAGVFSLAIGFSLSNTPHLIESYLSWSMVIVLGFVIGGIFLIYRSIGGFSDLKKLGKPGLYSFLATVLAFVGTYFLR